MGIGYFSGNSIISNGNCVGESLVKQVRTLSTVRSSSFAEATDQSMYYVYILRTSSNTLYIGQTNNLTKRTEEHKNRKSKSAKYIRYFNSFELVYSEEYKTRKEAMRREYQLKKLSKEKKESLIRGHIKH